MRSLVEVLEDAAHRSAFEVVLGSAHATVFSTPWGRELERQVSPGAELFEMLSEVIADDQQIELAVGNSIAVTLEARAMRWNLRARSGTEGISIRASCPELAASAAERARARAEEPDAPVRRHARPSSSSLIDETGELERLSETSGEPFYDVWAEAEGDDLPAAPPDNEDGEPVYIAATDSTVQGLPSFDELAPEDADVLVPEAWIRAEELVKAAKEAEACAEAEGRKGDAERDGAPDEGAVVERNADELHARLADQARTITSLQLEVAQYKRALSRHDRAIRQLHKRLMALESGEEDSSS